MENNIVSKPWGYEYIAYQNDYVALKVLHIRHGESTSLHCHPSKSTGLVLVDGEAIISFIADESKLTAPAKKMIRRGLFHKTHAISTMGVIMLEIETPVDKDDLVRLRDTYGRKNIGYENSQFELPRKEDCLTISVPNKDSNIYRLGASTLEVCYPNNFNNLRDNDLVMFLQGGIVKTINGRQHHVVSAGDVGEVKIVKQVLQEMDGFADNTITLYIK